MPDASRDQWKTIDKDLDRIDRLEQATHFVSRPLIAPGIALAFVIMVAILAAIFSGGSPERLIVIVHAVNAGGAAAARVEIPLWVMKIGAAGLSFGLVLFGPKLTRLVSGKITKLNAVRAYCVALSAAITVIVASWLELPVSSTHIAVGGIFGVGFYHEWHAERRLRLLGLEKDQVLPPEEHGRRKLVRRAYFLTILAAWVVKVPMAASLSALIFFGLSMLAG